MRWANTKFLSFFANSKEISNATGKNVATNVRENESMKEKKNVATIVATENESIAIREKQEKNDKKKHRKKEFFHAKILAETATHILQSVVAYSIIQVFSRSTVQPFRMHSTEWMAFIGSIPLLALFPPGIFWRRPFSAPTNLHKRSKTTGGGQAQFASIVLVIDHAPNWFRFFVVLLIDRSRTKKKIPMNQVNRAPCETFFVSLSTFEYLRFVFKCQTIEAKSSAILWRARSSVKWCRVAEQ